MMAALDAMLISRRHPHCVGLAAATPHVGARLHLVLQKGVDLPAVVHRVGRDEISVGAAQQRRTRDGSIGEIEQVSAKRQKVVVLKDLAHKCETVVEFGVRDGHSTKALLAGHPKKMLSYDIVDCPVVERLEPDGTKYKFILADAEQADIPDCDLLLVDSKHTAEHVLTLIRRHRGHVLRWFAFHDTDTYGAIGEDGKVGILAPIREQLGDWKPIYDSKASHGMLILERPK